MADDRRHADERLLREALAADDAPASPAAIAALARRASQPVRAVGSVEFVIVLLATAGALGVALVMGVGVVTAVLAALGIWRPAAMVLAVTGITGWAFFRRRRTVRLLEDCRRGVLESGTTVRPPAHTGGAPHGVRD
jgi:hypothetical protein